MKKATSFGYNSSEMTHFTFELFLIYFVFIRTHATENNISSLLKFETIEGIKSSIWFEYSLYFVLI